MNFQVRLFLNRVLADPDSFYCMVNCHLLSSDICRMIDNRFSNNLGEMVKNYGLVLIYAQEYNDARIRAYFDKHLVKNSQLAKPSSLKEYVAKMVKVPDSVKDTACSVDPNRFVTKCMLPVLLSSHPLQLTSYC